MYLVVPNGGYNADSLPVRVDLYHESAYLCLGTNKMKRLYLNIMKWFLPVLFISYMAGITRGEWGNNCPFPSIQKRGRA